MPHVGVLMERSLQDRSLKDAFIQLVARSAVAAVGKRQSIDGVKNGIQDAKTAFSSWDNCMQASFCKWPVIAVIIIGGLIILSIVWCIARCLCCGLSCCCECCYCLKCCGECCGCCDPPRGKRHKYLDDPFIPPHHEQNQAYRSQAPMTPSLPPPPAASSAPQYAVFDESGKKDADALPAMPSWEGAQSHKVLVEDEPVEMEPLKKPEATQNPSLNTAIPNATSPSPVSPDTRSPYGPPQGQNGPNGYMAAGHAESDPYSNHGQGYDQYDYNGYGQAAQDNMNQGYGMAAAGARTRTPHNDYNNGYGGQNQGYPQSRTPRPYNDEYGRSGTPGSYGAPPSYRTAPSANGYDNPSRMGSPGPQGAYGYGNNPSRMRSPGPQIGFEYPQRSQTQTPNSYRQYPPAPVRQYSDSSNRALMQPTHEHQYSDASAPESPPLQNSAGFDFNSGYSRPPTAPGQASQQQTTTQTANGGTAYPGYRTYRPQGGAT
ncbi:uncharacterized protein F4822DRAFT_70615 [Hypoxylon trugodes]|uniref:uncharacterized protein n=1 Tax=Hypoxylon trugodes TaxID=326681 RepID=UPI0021912168|nr:uncharacterized protein F4822DRAFT_70615 [Hypoxylon trugodes]KAI1383256.1 hypothetical protein F4822DRAFT_70615 [Hypoxylon trugodes]